MNNWREDAQPEWPDAASGTQTNPTARSATQAFPEAEEADETTALAKANGSASGADLTELLSAFDRFDQAEAPARTAGRRAAGEAFTPREGGAREETPRGVSRTTAADAVLRDPWGEAPGAPHAQDPHAQDPHAHDPHEVTIQLDGVGLQLDGSLRAAKGGPGGGGAEGSERPVFVDESGRRSRRFRRIGIAVGTACAGYAVVIAATVLSGNSDAPWLPVQDPKQDTPAGQVDTSPLPAESAPPAGAAGATPGTSPSAADGTTPSPGASATAPDASATSEEPRNGTDPEPTATKPTTRPDPDPTPADPDPTDTGTTPGPDPASTETGEPTPEPTPTEGGGDAGGTGTEAVAAVRPAVSPNEPSPEHTL